MRGPMSIPTRCGVETVLNLRDTASGRVALYRLNPPPGSQQEWMAIAPATPAQLHHALTTVFDSVGGASLGPPRTNGLTKCRAAPKRHVPQQSFLDKYRAGVV